MTNKISYRQQVFEALPDHYIGIAAKHNISRNTASKWLRKMHEEGHIHICEWEKTSKFSTKPCPIYDIGKMPDNEEGEDAEEWHFQTAKRRAIKLADRTIEKASQKPMQWFDFLSV